MALCASAAAVRQRGPEELARGRPVPVHRGEYQRGRAAIPIRTQLFAARPHQGQVGRFNRESVRRVIPHIADIDAPLLALVVAEVWVETWRRQEFEPQEQLVSIKEADGNALLRHGGGL